MNENISRLMDGEVDAVEFEQICGSMRSQDAMVAWACYHVIGDQLRGTHGQGTHGSSLQLSARICAALSAEPTILAPAAARPQGTKVATTAWAIAATLAAVTVVGWTAFSMVDAPPTAMAHARQAATVRAAQVTPPGDVPQDYLIAHQEYSPSMVGQSTGPFLRAVVVTGSEPRP